MTMCLPYVIKLSWIFLFISFGGSVDSRFSPFCDNVPSPPDCPDDCDGNSYYLSSDGADCLECPTCEPGYALDKICGNGLNEEPSCVQCPESTYKDGTMRQCMPCRTCTNSEELSPCTPSANRECGDCLDGYVRSQARFADPNTCIPQKDVQQEEVPIEKTNEQAPCEPVPPKCADDCDGNSYYLGRDGLCKMCLQCIPGQELNKRCGNGKNGDAVCRPCKPDSFSAEVGGRCTPCRICVNTQELSPCRPDSDRTCGDCLPGFFKTEGFFDPNACPNSCANNPRNTQQCKEWWREQERLTTTEEASESFNEPEDPRAVMGAKPPAPAEYEYDHKGNQQGEDLAIDESASRVSGHQTYKTTVIVLAGVLVTVVIVFVVGLVYYRRRRPGSSGSVTGEATLIAPGSPAASSTGSSMQIYNPGHKTPSPERERTAYGWHLVYDPECSPMLSRPVSSISSSSSPDRPSNSSTPRTGYDLRRQAHEQSMRSDSPLIARQPPTRPSVMRQLGNMPHDTSTSFRNEDVAAAVSAPSSLASSSSDRIVTENQYGDPVAFRELEDPSAGGQPIHPVVSPTGLLVRRRSSVHTNQTTSEYSSRRQSFGQSIGDDAYVNGKNGKSSSNKMDIVKGADINTFSKEPEAALFPADSSGGSDDKDGQTPENVEPGKKRTRGELPSSDIPNGNGCDGAAEHSLQIDHPRPRPALAPKVRSAPCFSTQPADRNDISTTVTITTSGSPTGPMINIRSDKDIHKVQIGDEYNNHRASAMAGNRASTDMSEGLQGSERTGDEEASDDDSAQEEDFLMD